MSEKTGIEWTDHTGGPYLGCSPWSPGCVNCYAWELAESRLEWLFRNAYKKAGFADWDTRPVWGEKATRVLTKGFWNDALRINAQHAKEKTFGSWFPSMIDWLDDMPAGIIDQAGNKLDPDKVRADFLHLIDRTPHIHWLLLTKRPDNFFDALSRAAAVYGNEHGATLFIRDWLYDGRPPANVSVGVSVEDQARANERREPFRKINCPRKFVSYEPALENVEWAGWEFVDQIIFGGESGAKSRECNVSWGLVAMAFCRAHDIKFFCKQLGAAPVWTREVELAWPAGVRIGSGDPARIYLNHAKGGDPAEWPEVLRVREGLLEE